jgi:hypothetical protein
MLKLATRAEAPTSERRRSQGPVPASGDRRDGRDGLKAALVRAPVVAAVDLQGHLFHHEA